MDINGPIDQTTFLIDINTNVQNVKIKTFEIVACACLDTSRCRFAPADKHISITKLKRTKSESVLHSPTLSLFAVLYYG